MPKVVKKDTKKPPPAKTKSETSNIDELTRYFESLKFTKAHRKILIKPF